jgi:hypothetical protein
MDKFLVLVDGRHLYPGHRRAWLREVGARAHHLRSVPLSNSRFDVEALTENPL